VLWGQKIRGFAFSALSQGCDPGHSFASGGNAQLAEDVSNVKLCRHYRSNAFQSNDLSTETSSIFRSFKLRGDLKVRALPINNSHFFANNNIYK